MLYHSVFSVENFMLCVWISRLFNPVGKKIGSQVSPGSHPKAPPGPFPHQGPCGVLMLLLIIFFISAKWASLLPPCLSPGLYRKICVQSWGSSGRHRRGQGQPARGRDKWVSPNSLEFPGILSVLPRDLLITPGLGVTLDWVPVMAKKTPQIFRN